MRVEGSISRPRSVVVALALIFASLAAALVGPVRLLATPANLDQQSRTVIAFWSLLFIALGFALTTALAYRRRWAYYLSLAGLVVTMLSGLLGVVRSLALGPLAAGFVILTLAVHIAALVLLLGRPAREWLGIGARLPTPGEWRADPSGRHQHRYWDGGAWTAHVADEGVAGVDPWPEAQG